MEHTITWSEAQLIHITQLFEEHNLPIDVISDIMKIPVNDITNKLIELQFITTPKGKVDEEKEKINQYNYQENILYNEELTNAMLYDCIQDLIQRVEILEHKLKQD